MAAHTASVPWANTPRPRTGQSPAVTRPKFTDTEAPGDDWRDRAACRRTDPEWFYPVSYAGGPSLLQIDEAKQICAACPVRARCLAFALESGDDHGILGGTTPDERKSLKRKAMRDRQRAGAQ